MARVVVRLDGPLRGLRTNEPKRGPTEGAECSLACRAAPSVVTIRLRHPLPSVYHEEYDVAVRYRLLRLLEHHLGHAGVWGACKTNRRAREQNSRQSVDDQQDA